MLGSLVWLVSLVSFGAQAEDREVMGRFRFSELFLSPRLRSVESGPGGFELEQSSLGFEWIKDDWARGVLKLGSGDLLRPALWYTPQPRDFSVVEAWIEGRGELGDVRAGLVRIPQGYEGANPEWNAIFPESSPRRWGWLQQRDYGVQFRWETRPWSTIFTVHNGESGENVDRWLWASGLWQYKDSDGFGVLITSSVGQTRPESTLGATEPGLQGFQFDTNAAAKIRSGILSIFREDRRNLYLIEMGRGEIIQGEKKSPYGWGRFDLSWNFAADSNVLFRYEQTQSDLHHSESIRILTGVGLALASRDNLQSMTFFAAQNREQPEIENNEFWVIFRLRSNLL